MSANAWPKELVFRSAARKLHVTFEDGASVDIPYEKLRVESPSAEVQGHGPGEKKVIIGKAHVSVTDAQPVGRYAVRIVFDDGHDTGIYSWAYLKELGAR